VKVTLTRYPLLYGGCVNKPTGKVYFVIMGESDALTERPTDTDEYHEWVEMTNDRGVKWYVSDDDMNLTSEEFWGE
jgi:hypothetical protein